MPQTTTYIIAMVAPILIALTAIFSYHHGKDAGIYEEMERQFDAAPFCRELLTHNK